MAIETRPHLTQFVGEMLIDMWPRRDGGDEQYVLLFASGKKLVFGVFQSPGLGVGLPTIEAEDR